MFFVKLITVILASIAVRAAPSVRDISITSRSLSKLKARDVPVCPPQPGYEAPPGENSRRVQDLSTDRLAEKGPGWYPSLCEKKYWICVHLMNGATYASLGKPGSGYVDQTFLLDDGTAVQAIWYWQGTVQYTAPEGTVNLYPAHGNSWICVKGGMKVHVFGTVTFEYLGNDADSNDLVCHCYWKDDGQRSSDNDIRIYPTA